MARVDGSDPERPYTVELKTRKDGELEAACSCPYDREPICKHVIAVLYAYAAQVSEGDALQGSAVEEAVRERRKKGRTEVRVKPVFGDPCFGVWHASSIVSTTHWKQVYQVHIRALDERKNYCTCPDWATNQLGTCKHIEAVLHEISKRSDYEQWRRRGPQFPFVYLSWDASTDPVIRLHRTMNMEADVVEILDSFFDRGGNFKGELPNDFFRLNDLLYGRDDVHIGEDAKGYAQRCSEDALQRLRAREIEQAIRGSNGTIPGVRARLYPYQVEGVAFLASRGRALLADDMGLGKTLQAICAATWLVEHSGVKRALVVCPASLKHQWAREIEKFTSHKASVIQGNAESRQVHYRADTTFFVINYELVLRDLSVINEILRPDLLVLDEAQRIKNWQTKIASTIKLIASRYAFVLTGTPLENRLEDLYSLLQVVDPRVLGPLWRYLNDFHVTDERGKVIGYRNLSELRRRIAPVMLRRDRRLVSDQLPERTEVRLDIPMSPKQRGLHNGAMSAAGQIARIAKRRPLTPSEQNRLIAALQEARMACNAAGLVDKETEGSPKLDEVANLLEDLCVQGNQKVVVFSQWELMTQMVETLAQRLGLGTVRLHG
ncbi:MAG TPA: DEAD/DEAH box helicase, partial [Bacteroidetes bacterium]|nr:DEAD/DEAH box helicase [Bacteroidota bacterium]